MKMPKEWSHNDLKVLCKAMLAGEKEAIEDFWSHFSPRVHPWFDAANYKDLEPSTLQYPPWVYRLGGAAPPAE